MKKTAFPLFLSVSLILASCSQSPQPTATTPSNSALTGATPEECSIFAQNGVVITRVDFKTDRDFIDIAKTFEPVGGTKAERYVLLDVGKSDFERLRVTAAVRGWTVNIDQAATRAANSGRISAQAISGYSCYRTVEETYTSAQNLVAQYPNLAAWNAFGPTWLKTRGLGGYDMYELVLTNKSTGGTKPKLMVTGSIHAREYTPAELVTRFAEYLLANYGKDADVTWMLDTQEVHLVLQTNPDGRKKAETGLSWRKNVNNTNGCTTANSVGTDLNRNFDFHWNNGGSSAAPCNETYMGASAASEPETQNLQTLMTNTFGDHRGPNITDAAPADTMGVYVDVHSYSDLVLWPWGDTTNPAPNASALQSLGRKLAYFNGYTPEQSVGLYPTSGTTNDYVYGQLGVAAYTIELGSAFFEPCSNFTGTILPQNQAALLYALRVARAPYQLGSGADVLNLSAPASVAQGGTFTLSGSADNTRFNNSNGSETARTVTSAKYFVDTAPWAGGTGISMTATDGTFNAGTEGLSASIDTTSLSQGKHIIYVQATNSAGTAGPVSAIFVTVTAPGTNVPPTASFTRMTSGLTASFTSTSTDPDGTIASYAWNFGDGSSATTATASHTYAAAGTYNVTLTVTDNAGASSTVTNAVTVSSATTTTYTGSLSATGANSYQPGSNGFSYAGGALKGVLSGTGKDFDLYLQKKGSGTTWTNVAQSLGSTSSETVNYTAASGTYRWRVYSYSGSGTYTLTETK